MERSPVNFRPFYVVAVAVGVAALLGYVYIINNTVGFILGCLFLYAVASVAVSVTLRCVFGKKALRNIFAWWFATAACLCAFVCGVVSAESWESSSKFDGDFSVSGRVCAVDISSGYYVFCLENVSFDGEDASGNMRLSLSSSDKNIGEFIEIGDTLIFNARVRVSALVGERFNGNAYKSDIRYRASVRSEDITVIFGKPTVTEKFLSGTRALLTENMGEKYGNIAFSMFLGDKYALNDGISQYFSAAGFGHIMAVSGLHIGFMIFTFGLILSKLGKKLRFSIIGVVLIVYAALADFSPSVVRAVIMAFVAGTGILIGGRRDILSSLLCAFSVILAFKPFYLFEPGFLLSFSAILGIAMFAGPIRRLCIKLGAPYKIGNAIGASIGVSIGITPVLAYMFGKVQIISWLGNLFVLPYVSVVYISIVFLMPIAAIPGCGAALMLSKYLLIPLDVAAYGLSAIPYANIGVSCSPAIFTCYPIMFCSSEFFMMKKGKPMVAAYSLLICIAICAVSFA